MPGKNGHHFADDIFRRSFLIEDIWISIKISQKFISMGPVNDIPALGQLMAWQQAINWTDDR